jgi:ATP-independent RNA helicase DbpA
MSPFSNLNIHKSILDNLAELGFACMTPVQEQSLPAILKGCDVIAQAKTGSGKTAAFGIGVLNKLELRNFSVQSLILCPTRELADQVAKELRRIARATQNVKILTLCGGSSIGAQLASLKHAAHIVVGTPGRILKHLDKSSLDLSSLDTLVLDEADRMLDMGFIDEIEKVIAYASKKRQTLLFSATYSEEILKLSSKIQTEAINIKTVATESVNQITEYFYDCSGDRKIKALVKIFSEHKPENVIIFSNTKVEAKELIDDLHSNGIEALALHGDLEQFQRNDVMVQFANKSCAVLVATDVAARGIDIKELSMVVNYGVPYDSTVYIHRIGRTGRAGKSGLAFTLYADRESYKAKKFEDKTRIFSSSKSLRLDLEFQLSPKYNTLVIEGGKKQKIRPGDILGSLTKDAGVQGKFIGKIDIYETQSYVAIHRDVIRKAIANLKKGKIKGRKFSLWTLPKP